MSITFQELAVAMIKCEQTQGQSVYQHGISVNQHLEELIYSLDSPSKDWKIPNWANQYRDELLANLHDKDTISKYTIYHDCGKPFCLEIDENGKQHFPNHAEISKQMFLEAGGCETAANLIGWDMDIHILSSEQIAEKCNIWNVKDACTLLLAALSELHSNAKMFGGIDSQSFKIKFKQIERRGNQICKHYFNSL